MLAEQNSFVCDLGDVHNLFIGCFKSAIPGVWWINVVNIFTTALRLTFNVMRNTFDFNSMTIMQFSLVFFCVLERECFHRPGICFVGAL